jgi:hypothetical protein
VHHCRQYHLVVIAASAIVAVDIDVIHTALDVHVVERTVQRRNADGTALSLLLLALVRQ